MQIIKVLASACWVWNGTFQFCQSL